MNAIINSTLTVVRRKAWLTIALAAISSLTALGQTITNPSFETNKFTVSPGYISDNTAITGWTANNDTGVGLNPAGGVNQFADNGAIPDGKNVAFIQYGGNTLSANMTGLVVGTTYKVTFRANASTNATSTPSLTVSVDATPILPLAVYAVGSTNPYCYLACEFTATAASQTLTLSNDDFSDSALLLDDFKLGVSSGAWKVEAWNDDASSGVDPQYVYTHAYSFGSAANTTINGILFTGVAGTNPSQANKFTTTFLGNVFNNDANNITGDSAVLARDFVYGGNVPAGSFQSINLQGLTPGTEYVATLYSVGFDAPGPTIRWATFSVGDDRLTINQDQFDNNNGIRMSYRYVADTNGTASLKIAPVNAGNVSIHIYGFSNREAVSRNVKPTISVQPRSTTVAQGVPVDFSVTATGFPAPTYQWRFNNANITGATAATYSLAQTTTQNAGDYTVVVANSVGSVTSIVARLTIGLPMNNSSFEVDSYLSWPGYSGDNPGDANTPAGPNVPITGWTLGSPNGAGINPISNGSSPFADNGLIPNGKQVAFLQANDALSQTISGLTVNGEYYVHYYENARSGVTPTVEVRLGTNTLIAPHAVLAVGGSNPYHEVYSDVFKATATSYDLAFIKSVPQGGDSTALIDNVALVQVPAGTAPFVTRDPQSIIVSVGDSTTLSAQGIGSLPLSFQWLKNGTAIDGATNPSLALSNIQKTDDADYAVKITNGAGTVTSAAAHLSVYEPIPDLYNTGVDSNRVALADGAVDPHYQLVENADTNSTAAIVEDSTVFPISDGTWLRDTAVSKWIGPQLNTSASAVGFYTYRTVIDLKDRDPKTVVILGRWAADNAGRDIRVNGVSTANPESPGFGSYTAFAIYGTNINFVAGSNAIDFVVENVSAIGYTGLRAEILSSNVRIPPGVAPEITAQPTSQTVAEGDTVTFSATAKGTAPLSYQWKKNGVSLPGQTGLTMTLTNVTTADAGSYTITISNSAGTAVSQPAQLTVAFRRIPGIFGTGVGTDGQLLAGGAIDPHYKLTVSADPDFQGPDAIVMNEGWPIQAGVWVPNGPDSKWISLQASQATGNAEGDYTYQTTFNLTGYDLSQVQIVGGWAVDNAGTDILVNGTSSGLTCPGFNAFASFTITNGLVAGTNTLDFMVNNAPATPNPTGLRVDLKGLLKIQVQTGPTLKISLSGNTVSISWAPVATGQRLQSATDVKGEWIDISPASNPYTANVTDARKFYRIAQ